MFSIILYEPEIPPNTGNIIRLCANTGATLHLIEPLGFVLDDKNLKRAGLDYHSLTNIHIHPDYATCMTHFSNRRVFALSAKGTTLYTEPQFVAGDAFLFGPETRGLPADLRDSFPKEQLLRLPQLTSGRSLNLSNTAAIMVFEAWRQLKFSLLS
jgi:tRNA (cytidine/uridine-2'-O-)-methyltransferase